MNNRFVATPEMDSFIRENYLLPARDLATRFNARFNTNRTSQQLHSMRKARGLKTGRTGRFYTGQPRLPGSGAKGPSSTSFKKGDEPKNKQAIGSEAVTQDGYVRVKVSHPNKWVFKHRLVWEAENGPIKSGLVIWFQDQDKTNCAIENLVLIPRSLQVRFNKLQLTGQPEELQETFKLIAQLQDRSGQLKREAV